MVLLVVIGILILGLNYSKLKLGYKYYIAPRNPKGPEKQSDFPQVFLAVNLATYYENLKVIAQKYFHIHILDTVTYKNNTYPIYELTKIQHTTNNQESEKKVLLLAGVHGNETGGILAVIEFLKEFNKNPSRFHDWSIKIVTPINPVGSTEMSRYNEYGYDLNRNIKNSSQTGAVLQRSVIDTYQPDALINLHESPSSGFFMHSNDLLEDTLLFKILKDIEDQGIMLATKDYLGQRLHTPGNSKIKGYLKFLKNLFKVQALGDYAMDRGIIDITTESGWNAEDIFQRVNSHVLVICSFLDHYQK